MSNKYRPILHVVEAVQWDGSPERHEFFKEATSVGVHQRGVITNVRVATPTGARTIVYGEYVIKRNGEFTVMSQAEFEKLYESADKEDPQAMLIADLLDQLRAFRLRG